MSDQHAAGGGDHGHVGHVVPLWLLAAVAVALMFFTFITVAVTKVDFGSQMNFGIAMIIALVKSVLVATYFMHLKWDKPFNTVIFLISISLVVLFITFIILDSGQYQEILIPGYAPAIEQAATTP
jgi:cytochrome c oxidase subunit 4